MPNVWTITRDGLSPVLAAFAGGYLFAWGISTLGITGLVAFGASYHSAETALLILAFPVCLAAFLWAFASPRRYRCCLLLASAGLLMSAAGWQLQHQLLS